MHDTRKSELIRLVVCLLGGVVFGVSLVEALVATSVVSVVGYGADVAGAAAGLGLGLLRYGGREAPRPTRGELCSGCSHGRLMGSSPEPS